MKKEKQLENKSNDVGTYIILGDSSKSMTLKYA